MRATPCQLHHRSVASSSSREMRGGRGGSCEDLLMTTWRWTCGWSGDYDGQAPTRDAKRGRSMLPPDTTATALPRPARPVNAAATAHAAAPSTMTWVRSATNFIAAAASSSETTIDPDRRESSGHIVSSTDLPPAPSTNDACQPSKY